MVKKHFTVVIEKDEDGVFIGSVPALKGCYAYGESLDMLMKNIEEAITANLEALKKANEEIPEYRFSGVTDLEIEVEL